MEDFLFDVDAFLVEGAELFSPRAVEQRLLVMCHLAQGMAKSASPETVAKRARSLQLAAATSIQEDRDAFLQCVSFERLGIAHGHCDPGPLREALKDKIYMVQAAHSQAAEHLDVSEQKYILGFVPSSYLDAFRRVGGVPEFISDEELRKLVDSAGFPAPESGFPEGSLDIFRRMKRIFPRWLEKHGHPEKWARVAAKLEGNRAGGSTGPINRTRKLALEAVSKFAEDYPERSDFGATVKAAKGFKLKGCPKAGETIEEILKGRRSNHQPETILKKIPWTKWELSDLELALEMLSPAQKGTQQKK